MRAKFEIPQRWVVRLGVVALLTSCSPAISRSPRTYAQGVDSASSACARNPALCKAQFGEQFATVPTGPALSGPQIAAINAAGAASAIRMAIDAELETRIRKALSECADEARSRIMLEHFKDRSPTPKECQEKIVSQDGKTITRAMHLGNEQHKLALQCAEQRLTGLKPGGFSIEPRYRIDPHTGKVQHIPRSQVDALLSQGRSAELLGTLVPDVVIHAGNPLLVQLIFDFKFPCVNGGDPPWREYGNGHPHQGLTQKEVYQSTLGARALRVIPRLGVLE